MNAELNQSCSLETVIEAQMQRHATRLLAELLITCIEQGNAAGMNELKYSC